MAILEKLQNLSMRRSINNNILSLKYWILSVKVYRSYGRKFTQGVDTCIVDIVFPHKLNSDYFDHPKMAASKTFDVFFSVSFVLHFLCTFAFNEDPPSFVYRADFREPSDIFLHGFQHLGDNDNLVDHVIDDSCSSGKKKNSAFVATSLDENMATEFGLNLLWTTPGAGFFICVYKIPATEFFYDAIESLRKAYKETGKKHFLNLVETFEEEQEWVAYHGVPREQIFSAFTYKKGSKMGTAELAVKENNDFYVSENTRGNRDVYPVVRPANAVTLIASNLPNPVSACFASCPSANSAQFNSGGYRVRQIVYETSLSNEKGTFWDSIRQKLTERLLPWKEVTTVRRGHTIERPEE